MWRGIAGGEELCFTDITRPNPYPVGPSVEEEAVHALCPCVLLSYPQVKGGVLSWP